MRTTGLLLLTALSMLASTGAALAQGVPNFRDDRRLPAPVPQSTAPTGDPVEAKRRADAEDAKRKAEETTRQLGELEAKRKADAEDLQRREAEARSKAAEEARRSAEAEAAKRADEEARRIAEADARKKIEEEARRRAEADARVAAAEEARRAADAEAKRKAEDDARRLAELEARKRAEDEAKRVADAELKRKAAEEARRLADIELRKKADLEARQQAEADARRKAEDEARRNAEAEALKRAEAEARRLAASIAAKAADEARLKEAARIFAGATDVQRLLSRGLQFLTNGDVASARLLFERAADAGSADGARELAKTYDATQLTLRGLAPGSADVALVQQWDVRARELQAVADAEARKQATAPPVGPVTEATARVAAVPPVQSSPDRPSAAETVQSAVGLAAAPTTAIPGDGGRFLARGRALLEKGDIAAARAFFERAADDGSIEAALSLARTYDPQVRAAAATVLGVPADRSQALRWYLRAQQLGAVDLAATLDRLARP